MNGKGSKIVIGLLIVVIALLAVMLLRRPMETTVIMEQSVPTTDGSGMVIGYASDGVTVIDDADALNDKIAAKVVLTFTPDLDATPPTAASSSTPPASGSGD